MIKMPVHNLHSNKPIPPRVFDVVIDGDKLDLEIKTGMNKYVRNNSLTTSPQGGISLRKTYFNAY